MTPVLPHKVKMQYVHFKSHAEYLLFPWIILEEIGRQSMFFHKGAFTISNIIMCIQTFSMEVNWPEILTFNGSIHVLYL